MEISERVKKLAKNKGLTISKLEKELAFGNGTIRNWDKNSPSIDKIQKVADYFNVSTDYLLGRVESPNEYSIDNDSMPEIMKPFRSYFTDFVFEPDTEYKVQTKEQIQKSIEEDLKKNNANDFENFEKLINLLPENKKGRLITIYELLKEITNDPKAMMKLQIESITESFNKNFVSFPIVSTIKSGKPIFSEENYEGYFPTDKQYISEDKEYIYLKIKDNSMDKEFKEGSLVLVQPQMYIENGDIGVILFNGFEATVRRIFIKDNLITLMPQSNNPEYIPETYDRSKEEVQIIGKVILAVKKY